VRLHHIWTWFWWYRELKLTLRLPKPNVESVDKVTRDSVNVFYLQVKCPWMMVTWATPARSHLSQGDQCQLVAVRDTMQGGCHGTVLGCRDLLLKVMELSRSFVVPSAVNCSITRVLWRSTSWHTAMNGNIHAPNARRPSRDRITCKHHLSHIVHYFEFIPILLCSLWLIWVLFIFHFFLLLFLISVSVLVIISIPNCDCLYQY